MCAKNCVSIHMGPFHRIGPGLLLAAAAAFAAGPSQAADCASAAATEQEINVSAGVYSERAVATVPMKIRVPAGTDTGLEAECLRLEGRDAESRMAAEVARASRCGEAARRVQLKRAANGSIAALGSVVDTEAYRDCLEGRIAVEVLDEQ